MTEKAISFITEKGETMHHNEITWKIFERTGELTGQETFPMRSFSINPGSRYLGINGRVYEVCTQKSCTPEPLGVFKAQMVFYRVVSEPREDLQFCCDTTFRSMFRPLIHGGKR